MIDEIPSKFLGKWRRLLNLAADIFDVPAALIMRLNPSTIEVLVASESSGNPYRERAKENLKQGFYCETVLDTDRELQVLDAVADPDWSENPDVGLGMINYLGLPLIWPDGQKFGTLCVLDRKPRDHAHSNRKLLRHFKEQLETDFRLIDFEQGLIDSNDQLGHLVEQRTAELQSEMAERERLEQSLRQVQKMEALSLMAGGVAHDLNNILSGVVSYPDVLLTQLDEQDPLREALQTIRDSGLRAARVVDDLLMVARPMARVKDAVNVNDIVAEYLASPEGLTLQSDNPAVRVVAKLDPELMNIDSAPVSITKCVMNLVINAVEAMPSGGAVEIVTRYESVGFGDHLLKPGNYVAVRVSDTGPGINVDEQQRIFEPYFTTKKLGRSGTGLGLTAVWTTVLEHQGHVFVDSSPQGTSFDMYFPASAQGLPSKRELAASIHTAQHNEYVLVVDDEPSQRDILATILDRLGYRAATVGSGEEAIERVRHENFDLIVLDMAMPPGINGRETFEAILHVNPKQKAIISSGLLESEEIQKARNLGISSVLGKPYTLADFATTVRTALTEIG